MDIHIGQIIRSRLKDKGITLRKFGDHMGMTDRNMQHFLNRNDIPISQLIRASEFLEEDLSQYLGISGFTKNLLQEPAVEYKKEKSIHLNISLTTEYESLKNFQDFISAVNIAGAKLGFKIG